MGEKKRKTKESAEDISGTLRERAEETINLKAAQTPPVSQITDDQALIHELQVHQVELELQNEDLERARRDAEVLREKYEDLYNFAPVGYFTVDTAGRILEANLTGCRLLRIVREKILGRRFQSFLHQSSIPVFLAFIDNALRHEQMQTCELELLRGEATPVFIRVDGTGVRGTEPGTSRVRMSISDVTARKKEENDLRESEERFHNVFDWANDAIMIHTLTTETVPGRFIEVNTRACEMLGYSRDQLLSMGPPDIVPKPLHPLLTDLIRRAAGEETFLFEMELKRKDGTTFPVESNEHVVEYGKRKVWVSIIRDITARKETEKALRESEERFRDLFDNMRSGVAVYEPVRGGDDFVFRDLNHAAENIDNIRREDAVGHSVLEVFPGVKEFGLFDVFRRVARTSVAESHPVSIYRDNRISGWRENFIYKLSSGEIVAVYEDVTARKQAEEAARIAQERLGIALRAARAGTWDWDVVSGEMIWSPEFFELFGLPPEVSPSFDAWLAVVHPDDREPAMEEINRAVREHAFLWNEYRILLSGGEIRWIGAGGGTTYEESGAPLHMSGVCIDITARKRAEERLQESRVHYQELVENISDVIFVLDLEGKITYISPVIRTRYGYSPDEVTGMHFSRFIHPDDLPAVSDAFRNIVSGECREDTFRILTREGTQRYVRVTETPRLADGQITGFNYVMADITDQVGAENALRQANKKLNLLSGITRHDILNQVAILEGYLELAGDAEKSPEVKEYFGHLYQAVKTIQHQIEFTREYQEIGVNASTWQNIRDLVTAAAKAFDLSQVTLTVTCSGAEIFADPLLLKVFYNLIDNSLRYAPPFTTITVTCHETGKEMTIVFADDGVGIPPEDKAHLFEHGFGKHTGLGLFLSREILAITGISIAENGEPGKGARFVISVPKGAYRGFGKPDTR